MKLILEAILISLLLLYVLFIFPTQWLKIERVKLDTGIGVRILQISDIHVERLRISPARLNRIIQKERPDLVVLTGDFTERANELKRVKRVAEAIMVTGIPAYAVLGNHDHRLKNGNLERLVRLLELHQIRVLRNENEAVSFPSFQLLGIDDFNSRKSDIPRTFRRVDPRKPAVIITHDPNIVLSIRRPFTYLMAGHLHGKQFNLPFLYHFKQKGELGAMGIYKGIHKTSYGTYYISKGIGQAGINARFMVRSEITVHEL